MAALDAYGAGGVADQAHRTVMIDLGVMALRARRCTYKHWANRQQVWHKALSDVVCVALLRDLVLSLVLGPKFLLLLALP